MNVRLFEEIYRDYYPLSLPEFTKDVKALKKEYEEAPVKTNIKIFDALNYFITNSKDSYNLYCDYIDKTYF